MVQMVSLVIPFIKIFNDTALAVNQGGKRKGAMCAYMEIWHMDLEQFIDRKIQVMSVVRMILTRLAGFDLFMQRLQKKTGQCSAQQMYQNCMIYMVKSLKRSMSIMNH